MHQLDGRRKLLQMAFAIGAGAEDNGNRCFVSGTVFLVLDIFLWILRLRGQNVLVVLLRESYGAALWTVSLIGFLLALAGSVAINVFNPDLTSI